ncbi:unnamed protein product [Anisakis simplex]|uniref:Ovule protein n=1 Tax=Anisakis simplex TaxID=6269 RepID=A0A0M3KHY7_ANISI|nr:unnamed protein product [Anisakis simplex]
MQSTALEGDIPQSEQQVQKSSVAETAAFIAGAASFISYFVLWKVIYLSQNNKCKSLLWPKQLHSLQVLQFCH